jgi:ribonucleoside-triphosphate reductase
MIINLWYEKWLNCSEWRKLAHEIAQFIVEKINYFMKRDKAPVSLEFAPSENWAPTLARKDIEFVEKIKNWEKSIAFPNETFEYHWDIFVQWDYPDVFLTSWFQPPYQEKNIWLQIQVSAEFQSYATGGSVQHFFLWEKIPLQAKIKLIQSTFSKPVSYMTLTPTITTCGDCWQQIVWEYLMCPKCWSTNVMVASRVIWYLRPIAWKNLRKENWRLDWDENYWQNSRRVDRASRKQTIQEDIKLLMQD